MRQTYAIKMTTRLQAPGYLPGFNTRAEAEEYLMNYERLPDCNYTVVYVTEYFNRAKDKDGKFTLSTIAEIPDTGAI